MYKYTILLGFAGLALLAAPAAAEDVLFAGTLTTTCNLSVNTPGSLGIDANGNLSTAAGAPGTLMILSVGSNQLTVDPPVMTQRPPAYTRGVETMKGAFSGLGSFSVADQPLTDTRTTRIVGTVPATQLILHAEAGNTLGFAPGDYQLKTVVTCN